MDSFTISKGIIYIIIDLFLTFGAAAGALASGIIVFAIMRTSSPGAAPFFALAGGVTMYLAGLAGRAHARPFLQKHLLPPTDPEK